MNRDEIKDNLRKTIAKVSGLTPDKITDSASYVDDLGLDSLTILEIVVEVDYSFGVKIPEEKMEKIRTVEDTVRIVEECMSVAVAS